jgi:uncharacterized protein YoxC
MIIRLSTTDIPLIIGAVLLVMLCVLVWHLTALVKDLRRVVNKSETGITNTVSNVEKITTDTNDIYGIIIGKLLSLLDAKKSASANKE